MNDEQWSHFVKVHGGHLKFDILPPSEHRIIKAQGCALGFLKGGTADPSDSKPTRIDAASRELQKSARAIGETLATVFDKSNDVVQWRTRNLSTGLLAPNASVIRDWVMQRHQSATLTLRVPVEVPIGETFNVREPLPGNTYTPSGSGWDCELMIPNPEGTAALCFPVSQTSELGKLVKLQNWISEIFRCWRADAALFILTGTAPSYEPIDMSHRYLERSTETGTFRRTRYTLEFDSEVTPRRIYEYLLRHFGNLKRPGKGKLMPVNEETLRLAEFGLRHGENQVKEWLKKNPKSKVKENKFYNQRVQRGLDFIFGKDTAIQSYMAELRSTTVETQAKGADKPKKSTSRSGKQG